MKILIIKTRKKIKKKTKFKFQIMIQYLYAYGPFSCKFGFDPFFRIS